MAVKTETKSPLMNWLTNLSQEQRSVIIAYSMIILLIIFGALAISPQFATPDFLILQLLKASILGIVATGQMFVILTGNIDLSVSWTLNLSAVLLTSIVLGQNSELWKGLMAALSVGLVVGLLNGLGVAYLRVPSMVLTLGMNALVKGVTVFYTGAQPKGDAPSILNFVVHYRLGGGVSMAVIIWMVIAVISIIVLHRSTLGRKIYAVGNNEIATYLSGAKTNLVLISVFVIAGVMYSLAGVLLTGYAGRSYNEMGDPLLLPSIAAVVVGGASILGGSGLYLGTIAGVIIVTLLESVLSLLQIPQSGRNIVFGLVILAMLFFYGRSSKVRG
ncbi:MAG: ABC transporter permease [Anaerolineae bacterium]|nr:ABC transporter permease [Anaerolineae bacterium]MCB0177321.1 ABC transporter permease [Anaerolineae bacterium]MCB0225039.1 ABC transporter permease [Anaerolineae bacterium]